jgi:hypothetical protein
MWVNIKTIVTIILFVLIITFNISSANSIWWLSEYPSFIMKVETAKSHMLTTTYKTGPNLSAEGKYEILKMPKKGIVFKSILPKEAIVSVDPKTGKTEASSNKPQIIIRDHDLDGIPDDFIMEPKGMPLYDEKLTKDGFIKYRNKPEHQVILMQWVLGIGYSINHFLHGIDSPMPRK